MEIRINPRGVLEINDARICFRNFRGEKGQFNDEGDRSFHLVIAGGTFDDGRPGSKPIEVTAEEMAEFLQREQNRYGAGWNVKIKAPREDGEAPFIHMPVKVKFNDRGPAIYLNSGGNVVKLDEESVGMLDEIDIMNVDMDIRPYDGEGRFGAHRTAYLQSIHVVQEIDRFAARYAEEEYPEEY